MKPLSLSVLLLLMAFSLQAHHPDMPPGFAMEEGFITGLEKPTDLKISPDGRIFVTEKTGSIRIVENGILLPQPFYTVSTQTVNERGLGGIVLDPDFDTNGYVYIYYTLPNSNHNRLARITAAGNTALPGSEMELMVFDSMRTSWHNGGGMVFDTTGKLIVGIGDGVAYAPWMSTNLSKILRLNPDGSIPTDNPFYTQNSGIYRAIVASGVRNPYSMAISKLSGRIFFNDVGNEIAEEVDELILGRNYGWPFVEGPIDSLTPPPANYTDPLYAFDHNFGCAIVGATFYEPDVSLFPAEYVGKYFFLEYCESKLLCMDPDDYTVTEFGTHLGSNYNNLEASPDGYLYLINVDEGNLARISYQGINAPPLISIQPKDRTSALGESALFRVEATGDTLSYEWFQNGTSIQSGTSPQLLLNNVQMSANQSEFSVRVTNPHGFVDSDTALLTVVNGSRPFIQFQSVTQTYAAGDTLLFAANVSDPDQQSVPLTDLTWEIFFHHDQHAHPALSPVSGIAAGSYIVDTYGEVDTNVFYRIHLTAIDSSGLTRNDFVDVLPRKTTMQVRSVPPGIEVNIDGAYQKTDFDLRSVQNLNRTLQMPPSAVVGDSLYQFVRWQDGQDTLIRVFSAQPGTISATYSAILPLHSSYPSSGNLDIYTDTSSIRQYYGSKSVSRIKENWDITNPYIWAQPPFPDDYWSARWEGSAIVPASELYTFYLFHDSRASLWINGNLLIDHSEVDYLRDDTAQIWLNGGDSISIVVEYDHFEYVARVELDWSYSIVARHNLSFSSSDSAFNSRPPITLDEGGAILYPNPTDQNVVYLYLDPSVYQGTEYAIQLIDPLANVLRLETGIAGDAPMPFSVENLSPGLYLFRVIVGEKEKVMRFLKR